VGSTSWRMKYRDPELATTATGASGVPTLRPIRCNRSRIAGGGQSEMAVLLAVLHRRFDHLFQRRVEQIGGQVSGWFQVRFDDSAPDRLAYILG